MKDLFKNTDRKLYLTDEQWVKFMSRSDIRMPLDRQIAMQLELAGRSPVISPNYEYLNSSGLSSLLIDLKHSKNLNLEECAVLATKTALDHLRVTTKPYELPATNSSSDFIINGVPIIGLPLSEQEALIRLGRGINLVIVNKAKSVCRITKYLHEKDSGEFVEAKLNLKVLDFFLIK